MFVSLFTAFLQARCDIGDMLDVTSGGGEFRELVSSSFALSISRPLRQNICRSHTHSLSLSHPLTHSISTILRAFFSTPLLSPLSNCRPLGRRVGQLRFVVCGGVGPIGRHQVQVRERKVSTCSCKMLYREEEEEAEEEAEEQYYSSLPLDACSQRSSLQGSFLNMWPFFLTFFFFSEPLNYLDVLLFPPVSKLYLHM